VWKAWSDPHHLGQWWGPLGFTTTTHRLDLRTGGQWLHTMHGPDGTDYPHRIRFIEVIPGERLVYLHDSGQDDDPLGFTTTITFVDRGDYTELVMSGVFRSEAARDEVIARFGALEGGKQTLARLADEVAVMGDGVVFSLSRLFDAPRDLVWKVYTEAEHLEKWWGPKGMTMKRATVDLRPGGLFHYGMATPDGHEMWGKFIYRDIAPPSRLVFVVSFSDPEGGTTRHPMAPEWPLEMLNVVTFEERDGRTIIEMKSTPIHATEAERAVFAKGFPSMQQGYKGTLDQLDAYLAQL
jgi:uncharacterized protein YndB with AHSA1/START domain